MGHQSNEARKALRAYARDLQATANRGSLLPSAGVSNQDDASVQFSGSGAPHQLALVAAAACVVLLGGIGLAATTGSTPLAQNQVAVPLSAQPASVDAVFARAGSIPTINAIQAFNDLGMTRSVNALRVASDAGVDSTETVTEAVSSLLSVVGEKLTATGAVSEADLEVALAVAALERAVRPPGLDHERLPPGLGGVPPGQDPSWTPLGQDPGFVPPGLTREPNPNKGGTNSSGNGRGTP